MKIAKTVTYVGAGTVEFLVADATREFYFLEMNTRLQVEHPVTELVTGFDLVREQFRIAAGDELSFTQQDIRLAGHAIECRIYAEDPANNFFPSPGTITELREPSGPGIRLDSGVYVGSEVSIHYDSMIAKLAVWGRTRAEAIERLHRALDEYEVCGITTTLPFFREVVKDEEFQRGQLDTGFIERFNSRRASAPLAQPTKEETHMAIIAAALDYRNRQHRVPQSSTSLSNRWKLSGRHAALNVSRNVTAKTSSKWRKS